MAKVPILPTDSASAAIAPPAANTANPADVAVGTATAPHTARRSSRPQVPEPFGIAWFFRPRRLFALALLAAMPVFAPWALRQLPSLADRPEYQLAFEAIRLEPPPTGHVPADLVRQVQKRAQQPEKLSTLDPDLPRNVAHAFAGHPWIAKVRSVRNEYPAKVTVTVEYRTPVALIAVPTGLYAIDAQGTLLPPEDFTAADRQRLLTVQGITSTPQGAAGRAWGDPTVTAAAKIAEFLGPRWKDWNVAALVAPATPFEPHRRTERELTDGDPVESNTISSRTVNPRPAELDGLVFELKTHGGSRILWGRMPGSNYPGELTGAQKIGRIERYLAEFGGFDKPAGPYEIDIRHWQEMTRRPLVNAPAAASRPKAASRPR